MDPQWTQAEFSGPQWADYQAQLRRLNNLKSAKGGFPGPGDLQTLLPKPVLTRSGQAVRFVPSTDIPGVAYEEHIYQTGEVSTRPENWHDLFNALVWSRFPRTKAAMNAAHLEQIENQQSTERGPRRDALTLFDECGVVVASRNTDVLNALAARDWQQSFQTFAQCWHAEVSVFICGHAMLEKFLKPYKAMTAQAILLQLDNTHEGLSRKELLESIERALAPAITIGKLLQSSSELSPLPLAGIPGWWAASQQDSAFYADRQVFRPPAAHLRPAHVLQLNGT